MDSLSHRVVSDGTDFGRTNNATIEVIIESKGFNNSLAGSQNCPNAWNRSSNNDALAKWTGIYLKDGELTYSHFTMLSPSDSCSPIPTSGHDRGLRLVYRRCLCCADHVSV